MSSTLAGDPPQVPALASRRVDQRFLPAVFITNLGNNIQLIASSLLIFKDSGTTLSVGWVYILVALPQMLLAVPLGRLADRFDRRKLCVTADVLSALTAAALPVWLLLGGTGTSAVYAVNLGLAVMAALFMPASLALMKERVPQERLGGFNINYEFAYQGGTMLSGVLGGIAVQFVGATPLFVFNAATFAASAVLIFSLGRRPERPEPDEWDRREAVTQAAPATPGPVLRLAVLYSIGSIIVTVANTLLLVVVVRRFHHGAATLGIADALACVGILIGIWIYKRVKDRFDYRLLIGVGYGVCAGLAFIQPQAIWTLLPGVFLAGLTFVFGRLPARSELMRHVPESRTGRVFGAANCFGLAVSVVLTVIVSAISDHHSVVLGYAALATVGTLATIAVIGSLYARPAAVRFHERRTR